MARVETVRIERSRAVAHRLTQSRTQIPVLILDRVLDRVLALALAPVLVLVLVLVLVPVLVPVPVLALALVPVLANLRSCLQQSRSRLLAEVGAGLRGASLEA